MAEAELEIGLHRRDVDNYAIELRYSQPDSDADVRLDDGSQILTQFDFEELRQLTMDSDAYGERLGGSLFRDPGMHTAFAQVRTAVESQNAILRLRLFIGPSAPELHSLRWETLRSPGEDTSLITGEHIIFSRYLSSRDWRPVHLRSKAALRALVVVANPTNLRDYQLAPVDVAGELKRAQQGLGDIPYSQLTAQGEATLNNIVQQLRDGYDILFLVAHGALIQGEPWLWLEKKDGSTARISGEDLIIHLRELRERPRLIVLASCQSAGVGREAGGDEGFLSALGPRLAEAGIPAVLAMQGNISMETEALFMPLFFQEILRDGQIDRAMATARGAVRSQSDWWMPVLFMRLKSGRIWYTPGFGDERQGMKKWPALLRSIRQGRCTPILGPGLTNSLLGSRRAMARRLAAAHHFPMSASSHEDYPQVTQFLSVDQDANFLLTAITQDLYQELEKRFDLSSDLPVGSLEQFSPDELMEYLDEQMTAAVALKRQQDQIETYKVLAELELPIYITTSPDNLLYRALIDAGKRPRLEICRWYDQEVGQAGYGGDASDLIPSKDEPLVYHLFGHMQDLDSLVLTEDSYFDYLIGITKNNELIPDEVRRSLVDSALLFLGFRMEDWNFRVLFRSIMSREGRRRRRRYAHVAAQIEPEEGRTEAPERARQYLEEYFDDADISIYWGGVEDFIQDLKQQLEGDAQ